MKLVIFDVDGTLVDSQAHIIASVHEAFTHLGLAVPDRDEILSIVGLSLPMAMRELAPSVGAEQIAQLTEFYKTEFHAQRLKQGAEASPLYPGAEAAVRALGGREDILLAIATGKSRRGLNALLQAWEFGNLFLSTQCADDHPSKPHPSMVEACLSDCGVAHEDAIVLGDTTYDMEMARAARVRGLGVSWGYHGASALKETGALAVLDDFGQLVPALEEIWKD